MLAADLVLDLNLQTRHASNPRDFTSVGERTYFVAESDLGSELWMTDGTNLGTSLVKDITPGPDGSYPYQLVSMGNTLLFQVGGQVWRTDGTEAGTYALDGLRNVLATTNEFALANGDMLTDGTNEGTRQIVAADARLTGDDPSVVVLVSQNTFFIQGRASRFYRVDTATATASRASEATRVTGKQVGDEIFLFRSEGNATSIRRLGARSGYL